MFLVCCIDVVVICDVVIGGDGGREVVTSLLTSEKVKGSIGRVGPLAVRMLLLLLLEVERKTALLTVVGLVGREGRRWLLVKGGVLREGGSRGGIWMRREVRRACPRVGLSHSKRIGGTGFL